MYATLLLLQFHCANYDRNKHDNNYHATLLKFPHYDDVVLLKEMIFVFSKLDTIIKGVKMRSKILFPSTV